MVKFQILQAPWEVVWRPQFPWDKDRIPHKPDLAVLKGPMCQILRPPHLNNVGNLWMLPNLDHQDLDLQELVLQGLDFQDLEFQDLDLQDLVYQDLDLQELDHQDLDLQDLDFNKEFNKVTHKDQG